MNAPLNLPPHSLESEQSLLGGLLLDGRGFDVVSDIITEADFYRDDHRRIYRRIGLLMAQNKPVDVVTVDEGLQACGESESVGGLAYLSELASNTPGVRSIKRYAEVIADRRLRRDLLGAADEIADIARAFGDQPASERLDKAEGLLLAVSETAARQSSEPVPVSAVLSEVIDEIQARYDNDGALQGLSTGFADFDSKTQGLQRGDLIVIAGRPGMGKTTIALNIAENVALAGGPALVFSMEMTKKQLVTRSLASIGEIELDRLRSGNMTDDDFSRMSLALSKLADSPLIIDDTAALSVAQMRARARRIHRKTPLKLLVVDYLQLASGQGQTRDQEVSSISRALKALAKELDLPVIALSQLSRKVEERTDKRPLMSDLRESGAIEQDADVIVMMYRDEYYRPETTYKGIAEAMIRKQRQGSPGDVHLAFQGQYCRFRNLSPGAWRDAAQQAQADKPMARKRRGMDDD
jgi:replicative DNA helicase